MEEVVKEVKTVLIRAKCECGGEFKYNDNGLQTLEYPPRYTHICDKCGKVERFSCLYPKIDYSEE